MQLQTMVGTVKLDRLEDQISYLIASLNRQLDQVVREQIAEEGVPAEQFRVLTALGDKDGEAMGALATRALVDPTTLTKMIDRMVADTLVFRAPAPNDRRKVLIFLAERGRAVLRHRKTILDQQSRVISERLDKTQAADLTSLLKELVATAPQV